MAANVCGPEPTATLAPPGHTATIGAGAVTEQALSVAFAGASDVAEVGLNTTSAVSTRPASSVTVRRTAPNPQEGAAAVAVAPAAFESVTSCFPTLAHSYELMLCPV